MKVTDQMVISQIGDSWFAVSVGTANKDTSKMIKLNITGKDIFEALTEGKTENEIVDLLLEKYEVDREKAIKSTKDVINTLKQKGVLTDD